MLEMALLKFLHLVDYSSSSPKVVNEVYTELRDMQLQNKGKKQGVYQKLSSKQKATIGKYASEHGVASAVRRYKDKNLKESSIRDRRNLYQKELAERSKMAKIGEEVCVDALPGKKRGKPPLLGEKLDGHLQEIILGMRSRGTPIGTSVVIGIGTGILLKHKKATASSFKLTKEWAKSVLRQMGFT